MKRYDDILIPMAFPNSRIFMPDQWYRPILHKLGYNRDNMTSLGHSLILLIEASSGKVIYTDFGRYSVPDNFSRARLHIEDPLLKVPIQANIKDGLVQNVEELMKWVLHAEDLHHSSGPLYYKQLPNANFEDAYAYAKHMCLRGYIRYDIIGKENSNCSRYVRSIILKSLDPSNIDWTYRKTIITPTPVDNVFYNYRKNGYWIYDGSKFSKHAHKILDSYRFYDGKREIHHKKKEIIQYDDKQWLYCFGVGAYFNYDFIDADQLILHKYDINGTLESSRKHRVVEGALSTDIEYEIAYGSSPKEYTLLREGQKVALIQRITSS